MEESRSEGLLAPVDAEMASNSTVPLKLGTNSVCNLGLKIQSKVSLANLATATLAWALIVARSNCFRKPIVENEI
jgi:hypothetical protein